MPFQGDKLLVPAGDGVALYRGSAPAGFATLVPLYLANADSLPVLAIDVPADAPLPTGWHAIGLRALYGQVPEAHFLLAGYVSQILFWQRTSQFCPVCGGTTRPVGGDWGKQCTNCGHSRYPQMSPAVLALVHDGERILLTHKAGWGPMYSIIAGFVEPGESLEQCVAREVMEEVSLQVADITYHGSQPWPFPSQLMLGFTMRYVSGEPVPEEGELDDARWFHIDALPPLPQPLSLSRQLIDGWVRSVRGGGRQ